MPHGRQAAVTGNISISGTWHMTSRRRIARLMTFTLLAGALLVCSDAWIGPGWGWAGHGNAIDRAAASLPGSLTGFIGLLAIGAIGLWLWTRQAR